MMKACSTLPILAVSLIGTSFGQTVTLNQVLHSAVVKASAEDARVEVAQARHFDFVIINGLFETALFDLKTVVHSQRLRYAAQQRNKSQVFAALDLI